MIIIDSYPSFTDVEPVHRNMVMIQMCRIREYYFKNVLRKKGQRKFDLKIYIFRILGCHLNPFFIPYSERDPQYAISFYEQTIEKNDMQKKINVSLCCAHS